jgi:flagellar biosynthesis/type III secretory pathway M-ring protein FliF/YscJ
LIRNLVPAKQSAQLLAHVGDDGLPTQTIETQPAGNQPALPAAQGKEVALTHEQQVAQARTLVNQDAKRVAQVVRGWVAQDE